MQSHLGHYYVMFKGQPVLKFIQIHIGCVLNHLDETISLCCGQRVGAALEGQQYHMPIFIQVASPTVDTTVGDIENFLNFMHELSTHCHSARCFRSALILRLVSHTLRKKKNDASQGFRNTL